MMQDRRRHQRYLVAGDRSCSVRYIDETAPIADVRDISRSGLGFLSNVPLRNAQEHDLALKPSWLDHEVPVRVKLVWKDFLRGRSLYGANFLSINPGNVFELLDSLYDDWLEVALGKK